MSDKPDNQMSDTIAISYSDIGNCKYFVIQYKRDGTREHDEVWYLNSNEYGGVGNTTDQKARQLHEMSENCHRFKDGGGSISLYILDTQNTKPIFGNVSSSGKFGDLILRIGDKEIYIYTGIAKESFNNAMKEYPQNISAHRKNISAHRKNILYTLKLILYLFLFILLLTLTTYTH